MKRIMKSQDVKPITTEHDTELPNRNINRETGSSNKKTRAVNTICIDLTPEECIHVHNSDKKNPKHGSDWLSVSVNGDVYSASMCIPKRVPNIITLSSTTKANALSSKNTSSQTANTECQLQQSLQLNLHRTTDSHDNCDRNSDLWDVKNSHKTSRNTTNVSKSFQPSGFAYSDGSSNVFAIPPNVNPDNLMENTQCASVPHTKDGNCHGVLEKIIIDGKPYAKCVIDALDDDDSIVAYDEGNNQILLRRSDETRHETRVRRLNKILADRIMNFIREIRQWEDTLSIEFRNFVYSDKEWAYKTLETVACDVCHQKVLVASLNTDCIMQTIKGCEKIRTAHWLRNFASYEGKQYKMEPKGNLCSRKYKLYSEFCLDQSVE